MSTKSIDLPIQGRPWKKLPVSALGAAQDVPTMLSPQERLFYHWVAGQFSAQGNAIVDLGCFVGGYTACFASGAPKTTPIFAYDRFTAKEHTKQRQLYAKGIPAFDGDDVLPLASTLNAPYKAQIQFIKGEIQN